MNAPPKTYDVCPQCRTAGPRRLGPREVCAQCASENAWRQAAGGKLVVTRAEIDAEQKRRAGEAAGESTLRKLFGWAPPAVSVVLAVLGVVAAVSALSPIAVGPLSGILDTLHSRAARALLAGGLGVPAGIIFMIRVRKHRHFRNIPVLAAHSLAIGACTIALGCGIWYWLGYSDGIGWQYARMPSLAISELTSPRTARIQQATVAIVAPDADGDAKLPALGSGAVVARSDAAAWIVTNSHVAMPYVSASVERAPERARPVWVELFDGRSAIGRVVWLAPPPLDVALIKIAIANAPHPVPIARSAEDIGEDAEVSFTPHPYRAGWLVHHGRVVRRRAHHTPAGTYSTLHTDLPVTPGDSGSGLYNERGELIGVNTWTLSLAVPAGISLPSETLRGVVEAIETGTLDQWTSRRSSQPAESKLESAP